MDFIKVYDFQNMLLPRGEDDVRFRSDGLTFCISVHFEDVKTLELKFEGCLFQINHIVPGPNLLCDDFDYYAVDAGCVYEVGGTTALERTKDYFLARHDKWLPPFSFSKKYFFVRFADHGVGYHMIATEFEAELL